MSNIMQYIWHFCVNNYPAIITILATSEKEAMETAKKFFFEDLIPVQQKIINNKDKIESLFYNESNSEDRNKLYRENRELVENLPVNLFVGPYSYSIEMLTENTSVYYGYNTNDYINGTFVQGDYKEITLKNMLEMSPNEIKPLYPISYMCALDG